MDWKNTISGIIDVVIHSGIKLIIAAIILFFSFKIINAIGKKILKLGESGKLDKTLSKVLAYIFKLGVKCLIAICMVGYVGIDTSGLAAVVTSFGVCAGLALNGALSNLAGGILIILTRPFKVDDYIEAQGYSGTVSDIYITYTRLITPDNKVVYIPNGALSAGNIVNYSENDTRRVDLTFSISYDSDTETAKAIISTLCSSHELILKDPAPTVKVSEYASSSVNIVARVWTHKNDYWTVHFDLLEAVKSAFDKKGINIPYNQLDVHVKND